MMKQQLIACIQRWIVLDHLNEKFAPQNCQLLVNIIILCCFVDYSRIL